jgi:hypothetical protein
MTSYCENTWGGYTVVDVELRERATVTETRGEFGNPKEGKPLPLETVTRGLVKKSS